MTEKPSIIFVDDQNNILQGFRRSLHGLEDVWTINYAAGGKEALKIMQDNAVDVIVCDTNMPVMRGTELLQEVRSLYPKTIRLVLSGGGGRSDDVAVLLRTSHQFLSKPFDFEKLKAKVDLLLMLRARVKNNSLIELVAGLSELPCSPNLYREFRKELEDDGADLDKMSGYIAQDPGLTAKMLQSLNSTFFGVSKAGIHPYKAAQSMGPGTISYLFDENTHFSTIDASHTNYAFLAERYKRSVQCATLLEALAAVENLPESARSIAYTTGMLNDIGSIILAHRLPNEYAKLIPYFKNGVSQREAEIKALGASHNDVGAYFLGLWGFPEAVINAAAYSQTPEKDPDQAVNMTTLAHVAQALVRADDLAGQKSHMNTAYLEKLGLIGRLQEWHDLNKEVQKMDLWKTWAFA